MRAEITATGVLVLTPETGVEAFAVMRWAEVAAQPRAEGAPRALRIDLSLFPETLPISAKNEAAWMGAKP